MSTSSRFGLRRLKYAATINDEALTEETDPDYELEHVDIGNVVSSGQIQGTAKYRFEAAPSRDRRKVRNGDVIISTVRAYLQTIAPIRTAPDNLIVSTGFAVVRPSPRKLHPHFCEYALREPEFLAEVERRSVGISYPAINASDLGDIPIPLPPLLQQQPIADFLVRETARLDALVAEKERLLELLAEKRRALITRAVTRGLPAEAAAQVGLNPAAPLRDSGLPWLGQIPTHWLLLRAKYLWREASFPVRGDDEMVTCFRDGQVTLRKNRREEGFTNAVKELGYQGIRAGQLVLHSMDAFAGAIGVSDSDGKCTPEYIICDALRVDVHNPYHGFLVRVMALNGFIVAMCAAVRERAPRIHFSDFGDMFFPVPSLDEQRAVVAYIAAETAKLDTLRSSAERTMALLKERRAALIAGAVTGRVSVPPNPPRQRKEAPC